MVKSDVTIRNATPGDAKAFGELLLMSSSFLVSLFGGSDNSALVNIFRRRKNLFSYEHAKIAEIDGRIAGMLLSYGYRTKSTQEVATGFHLCLEMGFDIVSKLTFFIRSGRLMDFVVEGDYYISNIAVFPEFRGRGIASKLIAEGELEAKSEDARRLVLDTETDHEDAIRLYGKLGFEVVKKDYIDLDERKYFFRMSKKID